MELTVGNIVVATGIRHLRRHAASSATATGVLPNVLTALEFERLTNASGPTGGRSSPAACRRTGGPRKRSGSSTPKPRPREAWPSSTAWDRATPNYNKHCSRVCCMYSLKFAHLVKEKLPDADLLPVLHRHAGLRKGLRGVLRAHQGRGRVRGARPHRPRSSRTRRAAW